jgi:hypothetical protein
MAGNLTGGQLDSMPLGPIDILVLEFQGNNFKGEILSNLHELVEAGTIRIIDLVIITKSRSGLISALEVAELKTEEQDALAPLHAAIRQMLTNDDVSAIGQTLADNTTAAVMLFENTWAVKTKKAMLEANGRFIAFERIPHDVVVQTLTDLAALEVSFA